MLPPELQPATGIEEKLSDRMNAIIAPHNNVWFFLARSNLERHQAFPISRDVDLDLHVLFLDADLGDIRVTVAVNIADVDGIHLRFSFPIKLATNSFLQKIDHTVQPVLLFKLIIKHFDIFCKQFFNGLFDFIGIISTIVCVF